MGATGTLVSCLLLVGVACVCADLSDDERIQGPGREKRRSPTGRPNQYDCPPSINQLAPVPPAPQPCPPGSHPLPMPGHRPYPRPPCGPWVDERGLCHVGDRVYGPSQCRVIFGNGAYSQMRDNPGVASVLPRPPGPQPVCVSDAPGHM